MLLATLFCLFNAVYGTKIAIFSGPLSTSQIIYGTQLADTLADNGYEVTLIRPCKASTIQPINKLVTKVCFETSESDSLQECNPYSTKKFSKIHELVEENRFFAENSVKTCEQIVQNNNFTKLLENQKIDLAILSDTDNCLLGVIHHIGIKKFIIATESQPSINLLISRGVPALHYSVHEENSNVIDRIQHYILNIYHYFYQTVFVDWPLTNILQERFGSDFPNIHSLRQQATLIISGAEPVLFENIPFNHQIQFIPNVNKGDYTNDAKVDLSVMTAEQVVIIRLDETIPLSKLLIDDLTHLFEKNPHIHFVWTTKTKQDVPKNVILTESFSFPEGTNVIFIHNGNYNDLQESLQKGVPSFVVPQTTYYKTAEIFAKRGVALISQESIVEDFQKMDKKQYKLNCLIYKKLLKSPKDSLATLRHAIEISLIDSFQFSQNNACFFKNTGLDSAPIIFLIVSAILIVFRKLMLWYYWSCFEISYKEKVKIQ